MGKAFRMALIAAMLIAAVLDERIQSDWPARFLRLSSFLVVALVAYRGWRRPKKV